MRTIFFVATIFALLFITFSLVSAAAENKGTNTETWADTPTTTEIWELISRGDVEGLKKKLDEDATMITSARSSDGRGALWWAIEYGKKDMYDILVAAGASEDERDADGKSPKELTSVGPTAWAQQQTQEQQIPDSGFEDDDDE